MRNYEVTFIVDPVLSDTEIKSTMSTYEELLKNENASIVHVDEMGLKQLAYPIKKRTTGVYYSIEYSSDTGALIPKMELALRRDERIMRFLTISLDKYGVKYNDDKRNGLIGKKKATEEAPKAEPAKKAEAPKAEAPKAEAPKAEAPKAEAPKAEAPKAEAPIAETPIAETPIAETVEVKTEATVAPVVAAAAAVVAESTTPVINNEEE